MKIAWRKPGIYITGVIALALALASFFLLNNGSPLSQDAIIPVTGDAVKLSCETNTLELPCGSQVIISELCGDYWATVARETAESLPADIAPYTFQDGISLTLLEGPELIGAKVLQTLPEQADIKMIFSCDVPIETILVWDAGLNDGFGAWAELSSNHFQNKSDRVELNLHTSGRVILVH